jgi:hypothetical protein
MTVVSQKACFKCGEIKPLDAFYRHPQMSDGRLNKCKVCTRRDVQENYAKRRAQYRAYDKARYADRYQRGHFRARDLAKKRARITLQNNVVRGKIVRPSHCEACGVACHPDAHHTDYARPLDVRWLCRTCHAKEHRHRDAA